MRIDRLIAAFNTTAMVLGYIVLILLLSFVVWVLGVWFDKWRYQRRRRRRHDREWDRIRAQWLAGDISIQPAQPADQRVIDTVDRIDTAVLDFTPEDIYDYEKELRHDASYYDQTG